MLETDIFKNILAYLCVLVISNLLIKNCVIELILFKSKDGMSVNNFSSEAIAKIFASSLCKKGFPISCLKTSIFGISSFLYPSTIITSHLLNGSLAKISNISYRLFSFPLLFFE